MFIRVYLWLGIACIAGCATTTTPAAPSAVVTLLAKKSIPESRAADAIAINRSTRADVAAALGETLAISFDSGFEVWIYRIEGDPSGKRWDGVHGGRGRGEESGVGEFVVLFAPSGVVAKTRIRPPSPNATAGERLKSG